MSAMSLRFAKRLPKNFIRQEDVAADAAAAPKAAATKATAAADAAKAPAAATNPQTYALLS